MRKKIFLSVLMAALFFLQSFAQQKTITGKVTDASTGQSLAGATVAVKGSKVATQTDNQGSFTLSVPENARTFIVTSVGFESQDIPIAGQSQFTVSLQVSNSKLNEVVVVGYGTQKRKDLTGSVSSINASTIEKTPVISAEQALQGRAAGVQVTSNDGAPGGNISVLIRGTGSLASYGNGPLYVVDGYPLSGGIQNINPSDIASIDVLKDASATAIYGIRAANGVVIITTKKGKRGGVQISFDAYNAFQSKPKEYKVLNAHDFATLSNEIEKDTTSSYAGLPAWHNPDALHNLDWQNAVYRPGLTQNYSVGIRGGSDKVLSAMSVGYYNQKGIVLGSYFKRLTVGLNMDYTPTKWLKASASAKYTYQDANNPFGTGSLVQLSELPPTMDSGNNVTPYIKDGKGNYGFFNPINSNTFKFNNPVYGIENNAYQNITNFLLANSSLEATIIDGLKIKTLAGVNTSNYSGSYYQPADNRASNQFPGAKPAPAFYSQHLNNTFEWVWENTLSYDKTFGPHTINFVGGISAQKNTNALMGGQGIPPNSVIRDLGQVSNLQLNQYGNGQNISTVASQFARLTYSFEDRYLITGTIRRDGSSRFDTGHQYGVFPSGAIAWKIKDESFLKDVSWINELKLRGSYGQVGNQSSIGLFQYEALYSTGGGPTLNGGGVDNLGYPFDKIYQGGIAQSQPANPGLKWETDYQTDIGVDAAFLNGDLTLTVDWYKRRSKDFLLTLAAPAQTGYNYITRNVGSMENTGLEFAVNYTNNRGRNFHYNLGLTLSTNKNTLTSITSGTNFVTNFGGFPPGGGTPAGDGWANITQTYVGGPVGEFYGYKTLGIFQSKAQIDALNAKAPGKIYQSAANQPGDRYFEDVNGDGVVNADDRVRLGSPQPKFFGGFNIDGSYKAWDVNIYFYGVYGNKICNYVESALESFPDRGSEGVENVSQQYYANRWTTSNPSNRYARANANDNGIGSNVPSSTWIEDGSFLKLKNLTVGYTLPGSIAKKVSLSKVRVYVSTQNLFTLTKYTGLDPEIGVQGGNATQNGVDTGTYPSSRFYTVGLNVTF